MLYGDNTSCEDAPKNYDESERTGTLEIFPEYQDGLDGLVAGQTIVVLFWLHKSDRDTFEVYQRGGKSRELRGVFSTRSPAKPYPITISEMKIIYEHCPLPIKKVAI